jgi:hypothetical protein
VKDASEAVGKIEPRVTAKVLVLSMILERRIAALLACSTGLTSALSHRSARQTGRLLQCSLRS